MLSAGRAGIAGLFDVHHHRGKAEEYAAPLPRGGQGIHGFFEADQETAMIGAFVLALRQRHDGGDFSEVAGDPAEFAPDFLQRPQVSQGLDLWRWPKFFAMKASIHVANPVRRRGVKSLSMNGRRSAIGQRQPTLEPYQTVFCVQYVAPHMSEAKQRNALQDGMTTQQRERREIH